MSTITTTEGVRIFYKDWGSGDPIVFVHGWPLTADAWDGQMLFMLEQGYRVIAHDRRGHGRSAQTWDNNTMDQYADDLSALMEQLDLENVTLVGHSTGGGEVTRYIGRHGTSRVARVVLLGAIPPLMVKTESHPRGLPREVFDQIRQGIANNRSQYLKDLAYAFYGFNRAEAQVSQGLIDSFWLQGMMGGVKSIYDSIEQFSESDFTEDLRMFDIPTLIVHGDDDQIVPIQASAFESCKLVKGAEIRVYKGAPHGLAQTMPHIFNKELLSFMQQREGRVEVQSNERIMRRSPHSQEQSASPPV